MAKAAAVNLANPWRRYFARLIDITLFSTVLSVVFWLAFSSVREAGKNIPGYPLVYLYAFNYLIACLSLVLEGVWYRLCGPTPGKRIMALEVVDLHGHPLTTRQYARRLADVFVAGYGLFIPFVSLVCMVRQKQWVQHRGATSYDMEKYRVNATVMPVYKKVLAVICFMLFVLSSIWPYLV